MGLRVCRETSVRNYNYTLLKMPEEHMKPEITRGSKVTATVTCSTFCTSVPRGKFTFSKRIFVEAKSKLINPVNPSGCCKYHLVQRQKFYVLPTHCIAVFCMVLRLNGDYCTTQH